MTCIHTFCLDPDNPERLDEYHFSTLFPEDYMHLVYKDGELLFDVIEVDCRRRRCIRLDVIGSYAYLCLECNDYMASRVDYGNYTVDTLLPVLPVLGNLADITV